MEINPNNYQKQEEIKILPRLIKQSATYKLFVPREVEGKIRYLIRKFPHTEWSGVLFTTHSGTFENGDLEIYCVDLFPMDIGTNGWTEFKMTPDVSAYMAKNIELFDCDLSLVHSHHTMGAFFSGQDLKTLWSEGNDTNCFISLIVDTKGTYQAAITRKVKTKQKVTTINLGDSYEFFGEGEKQLNLGGEVTEVTTDNTTIEYFILDVRREVVDNPYDFLDKRFEEIEAQKKQELDKFPPDAEQIHHLICQMITCSFIVNKDLDLKQWVTRHMNKKYEEIFPDSDNFDEWKEFVVEFCINRHVEANPPEGLYNDWELYQSKIAKAMKAELYQYSENPFIQEYIEVLNRYIYE